MLALTNGLLARRKLCAVHRTTMTRQLIQKLAIIVRPYEYRAVTGGRSDFLTFRIPATAEEILLDASSSAVECANVSFRRRKWPDIPCSHCRVHGI